jgi:hypothetical protein
LAIKGSLMLLGEMQILLLLPLLIPAIIVNADAQSKHGIGISNVPAPLRRALVSTLDHS